MANRHQALTKCSVRDTFLQAKNGGRNRGGREGGGVCARQDAFMSIMCLMEEIRGRGKDESRKCVFGKTFQGWEELVSLGVYAPRVRQGLGLGVHLFSYLSVVRFPPILERAMKLN